MTDRDGSNDPASADYVYEYDDLDRVTGIEQTLVGLTPVVEFDLGYDALGRRTSLASEIGGTADFGNVYAYDALGRLSDVYQLGSSGNAVTHKHVNFAYNAAGQFDVFSPAVEDGCRNKFGKSTRAAPMRKRYANGCWAFRIRFLMGVARSRGVRSCTRQEV